MRVEVLSMQSLVSAVRVADGDRLRVDQVAARYGRTNARVRAWARCGFMPRAGPDGRWSLAVLRAWELVVGDVLGRPA